MYIVFLLLPFVVHATIILDKDSAESTIKDSVTLKEVVVKASRPISRLNDDGIVTRIKGTILEKLGTARDVLGYLPGVSSINGSVEVFGKGVPLIYINGRMMRDYIELDQIKSDKIREIKLIQNPGARYDAQTNAVIRIYTERNAGDGFSFDNKTTIGYHDYVYGKEEVNANYRTGGLDIFGMLEYDRNKNKGSSNNIQEAWTNSHYETDIALSQRNRSQLYQGQLGFDYATKANQSFGLYYKYNRSPSTLKSSMSSTTFIDGNTDEGSTMNQNRSNRSYEHLVDGYYSGNIGKWSLDATFDILWKNNKSDIMANESTNTNDDRDITTYDKSSGRMIAGEAHTSHSLFKGNLNLGLEFTDSKRSDDFTNSQSILADNNNDIKETTTAIYAEMLQRFGKMSIRVGLRYEHVDSRYFEYGVKIEEQSRRYDKLFPSFLMTLPFKTSALQLSYSRKYKRPLYSQLSSTISYGNRYFYESGNPYLRPAYSDNFSLTYKYSWVIAMANYNHIKGRIISLGSPYGDDGSITLMKKVNSPSDINEWQVMLQAQPSIFGRNYYPALAIGVLGQVYKLDYRGNSKNFNRPMPMIRFNNIIRLPQNYVLTANFSWRGKGESENIRLSQTWQVGITATKTFNKHWEVRAALTDIFNTSGDNDFYIYSKQNRFYSTKNINARLAEISVRYKFNNSRSKYKGKGAGKSEIERFD